MANASLLTQKVQELHLSNKLEKSGQIQLDSSFSLNVSFAPDGTKCVGKLQQTLRDKEFAGGKFTMTVELVGIFSCTGATADEWLPMGTLIASPGCYDEVLYLYLARGLHYGATHPDEDEFLSLERMPLEELAERCMNGEITDAKTVCAALKAKNLLR